VSRLLGQDSARTGDRAAIARGVSRYHMQSVHEPDMRHGRKRKAERFDGHQGPVEVLIDRIVVAAAAATWAAAAAQSVKE